MDESSDFKDLVEKGFAKKIDKSWILRFGIYLSVKYLSNPKSDKTEMLVANSTISTESALLKLKEEMFGDSKN